MFDPGSGSISLHQNWINVNVIFSRFEEFLTCHDRVFSQQVSQNQPCMSDQTFFRRFKQKRENQNGPSSLISQNKTECFRLHQRFCYELIIVIITTIHIVIKYVK